VATAAPASDTNWRRLIPEADVFADDGTEGPERREVRCAFVAMIIRAMLPGADGILPMPIADRIHPCQASPGFHVDARGDKLTGQ